MTTLPLDPAPVLPEGWEARVPGYDDIDRLVEMATARRQLVRGSGSADVEAITSEVVGNASWTRRQVVASGPDGNIRAWATVHDRAAGRTGVELTIDAEAPDADAVAAGLIAWLEAVAVAYGSERAVDETQLDWLLDAGDTQLQGWLAEAGHRKTRTYLNMSRPVTADEQVPPPREGVTIRRVGSHELEDGTTVPVAEDLQAVHRMLEESFEDHFNSYRESFSEFAQRLREDPGHRWDHWWLALIDQDDVVAPGGALVGSVLGPDKSGAEGSYVDYIGVHQRSRGRGVAKALLWTIIADAAERGRNRVNLEVDADSPTGADGLYRSMGWENVYTTESWHKDVKIPHNGG